MQGNKLELSDKALRQIESIFDYHEGKRKGKGSDFLEVLWDCLEEIRENPKRWQYEGKAEDRIRRGVSKFPQAIILYAIEEYEIAVYEVYDSYQNRG
ncbi:MAG: hypothetical protein AAFR87_34295 [Bacteroidota bacterium]